jgi:Holliday junction resolvasome RuvABC endonuclease subunit
LRRCIQAHRLSAAEVTLRFVIGIDPGFAKLGWARVEIADRRGDGIVPFGLRPVLTAVGLISTDLVAQPGKAKGKRSKIDRADDARRAQEIYKKLLPIVNGAALVFAEEPLGMRDAGAAAKVGIAWGVIASVAAAADTFGSRWACSKPDQVKRSLLLPRTAEKIDVLEKLSTQPGFGRLPELLGACGCSVKRKPDGTPRNGQWEHPSDAAAAAFAGLSVLA